MKNSKQKDIEMTDGMAWANVPEDIPDVNYFEATEKLLYNFKRLEALVEDEDEYMHVELRRTSTSLVHNSKNTTMRVGLSEAVEQLRQQREISYQRTKIRFDEVARVIKLFEEKKEFVIIRMYYFNEDVQGIIRSEEYPYTWEKMVFELSEEGILHDAKTARRWRNAIVNDIAVCLFGKPAAVSAAMHLTKCNG